MANPVGVTSKATYTGVCKSNEIFDQLCDLIIDGKIDITKDGILAQGITRQTDHDGRKLLITYALKNGKLVKTYGAVGHDVSHEPQLANDAAGEYAYQPFDEKGEITKTKVDDPMWTISTFLDGQAKETLRQARYKGTRPGAEEFARVHYRHYKGWGKHQIKECLVLSDQAHITVILVPEAAAAATTATGNASVSSTAASN